MSEPEAVKPLLNTNTDAVNAFFSVVTAGGAHYRQIDWLMQNVFTPDVVGPPRVPRVGIAAGADPEGPQFVGSSGESRRSLRRCLLIAFQPQVLLLSRIRHIVIPHRTGRTLRGIR